MTSLTSATAGETPRQDEWLHWLFVREGRSMSCGLEIRDGFYTVTLLPLWTNEGQITETFESAAEAVRRHAQVTRFLQASGWLLVDGGAVRPAA